MNRNNKIRLNFYRIKLLAFIRGCSFYDFNRRDSESTWRPRVSEYERGILETLDKIGTYDDDFINIFDTDDFLVALKKVDDGTSMRLDIAKSKVGLFLIGGQSCWYDRYGKAYHTFPSNSEDVKPQTKAEVLQEKLDGQRVAKEDKSLEVLIKQQREEIEKLQGIINIRKETSDIEIYSIDFDTKPTSKDTVSISLLSDIHIDEVVNKESVLNLNEYNPEIAKKRIDNYFINLVKLVHHHQKNYKINRHILAILGDIIGGYIHPELEQTNSMSPLEAIKYAKQCLMSGLVFLHNNLNVETIDIVCVVGNHGRSTDKLQYANITQTSYEFFLYQDLEYMCREMGLSKFRFIIPNSSTAVLDIFGKKYMFLHGNQWKYAGGIGGFIVPFMRFFGRMSAIFNIECIFFGHYHTTLNTKRGIGNGSIKGYDAYCINKGLEYEQPQQSLVLINEKWGFTNFQSIFL